MHRRSFVAVSLLNISLVLVSCLATGCGGKTGNRVSGKVTFKGQPVPAGKIYIRPDGSKGNSGQAGYATISNGTYDTSAPGGQGAAPGAVIMELEGIDPNPPAGADPDVTTTMLFSGYTTTAELPAGDAVQDIVVPDEADKGPPQSEGSSIVVP